MRAVQVMVPKELVEEAGIFKDMQKTGASLLVEGILERTPEGTKQVPLSFACLALRLPANLYRT